jgi:hypothetical protein
VITTGRWCGVTLLAAAACLALPALAPAAGPPLSGTTLVAKLNAERARLGVFAGVTEVPEWSPSAPSTTGG